MSRTTYSERFAAIGTTFGSGNGRSSFNLPDLRGIFVRGWSDNGVLDEGRPFGSEQADEVKSHTHLQIARAPHGEKGSGALVGGKGTTHGNDNQDHTAPTGGTETRPRNIALLYCIKY